VAQRTHICSSLRGIREQYPSVVIGAITNGRGNPFHMPDVAPYFDFCTSGEDEGVFPFRKPDSGIYEAALRQFRGIATDCNDINWIHVGDDLANDVGASAACGAKTIWLTSNAEKAVGFWSTATPEEMQKRQEMDKVAKQFVNKEIYSLDGLIGAVEDIVQN
jgi:FMN phosphatase YigB (HAD superfamily)